ncbi:MAG: hypothetical protein QOI74_170 [Micromonosporaceae bacterium]|jgi:hypothetical protein|nr:hypothetical protein [Micromonosporaceae bacterium]MDT5036608.1 hypothetical protein [Micromonosporaceae bacterium]
MEKKLILRGALAGAVGGLLAFVFARIFAEPLIETAIDYGAGRDHAAGQHGGMDLFSRTTQANVGIGAGMIVFGLAMGTLYAVVYAVYLGRVGAVRPRTLALLVAGGGFLGFYLVPFVKYPANPPAVGRPETIGQRSGLYLVMVVASIAFLALSVWLGRRLQARFGTWNATLLAAAAFVVAVSVLMAALPSFGHLAYNTAHFGSHATETPGPLTDANGTIVYPGFPADVLYSFRFYSVAAQLILWATLGLIFAPLADRLLSAPTPTGRADRAPVNA